jgi:hypothetical protein
MAEPVTHAGMLLTVSGAASAVIGFIFDVPGSTVFAAAAGAFFAARLGKTVGYKKTFGLIAGGTFAAAMLTSLLIYLAGILYQQPPDAGQYPQRGVAFALAFCLIYYRKELVELGRCKLEGLKP